MSDNLKLRLTMSDLRKLVTELDSTNVTRIGGEDRVDKIPGGLADEKDIKDFDPKEIFLGIKDEMGEHSKSDEEVGLEITMDHLTKDPHYYSKQMGEIRRIVREELKNLNELVVDGGDFSDRTSGETKPQAKPQAQAQVPKGRNASQQVKDIMDSYDFAETVGGQFTGEMRDISGPVLSAAGKTSEGGRYETYSFVDVINDILTDEIKSLRKKGHDTIPKDKIGKLRYTLVQSMAPQAKDIATKISDILGELGGSAKAGADTNHFPTVTIYYPAGQ